MFLKERMSAQQVTGTTELFPSLLQKSKKPSPKPQQKQTSLSGNTAEK
jgi:hypothetical protein